jgi:hypothetical protein
MARIFGAILVLLAGLAVPAAEAGFRSPESLVRNVYAYYGDRSSDLSSGLPRDTTTARQYFDRSLQAAWGSLRDEPYDFFVQSPTWKLGAIAISILPAVRQDLCRRRLRQPRPRRHAEFHCRERTGRLGDRGCREPA